MVILIVLTSRRMQTVTNYFIANLALADVVIGLFSIPFQFQVAITIIEYDILILEKKQRFNHYNYNSSFNYRLLCFNDGIFQISCVLSVHFFR